MTKIVIVPGLNNSGPQHWQSWLETRVPSGSRIVMPDWATPDLKGWTQAVLDALEKVGPGAILVAHSFGCLATIRALQRSRRNAMGALLVAPADPVKFHLDRDAFSLPLPIRSVLVGSENDPWMRCRDAQELAHGLGAEFLNLGRVGHINVESGHGPWPGVTKLVRGLERPVVRTFRTEFSARSAVR
ncbi:MAG: alpha/beta hydrolase [Proteobacteria bacterium]|nr:alpha/beta hydrolase [Pseudomonadota bacterium]